MRIFERLRRLQSSTEPQPSPAPVRAPLPLDFLNDEVEQGGCCGGGCGGGGHGSKGREH